MGVEGSETLKTQVESSKVVTSSVCEKIISFHIIGEMLLTSNSFCIALALLSFY